MQAWENEHYDNDDDGDDDDEDGYRPIILWEFLLTRINLT